MLDPAFIVRSDVVPSGLKLVAYGPHKVALNSLVEDADDALTKAHHLIVSIKSGVDCARTIFDDGMVAVQTGRAVWTELWGRAIKIDGCVLKVGVGALNALTLTRSIGICVIEASEPESAHVGSERPFANPDVVLDPLGHSHFTSILVAVLTNVTMWATPGEIRMCIHDNVLVVIVCKQVVPKACIEMESVMEDKFQVGLLLPHHGSNIAVELLQNVEV